MQIATYILDTDVMTEHAKACFFHRLVLFVIQSERNNSKSNLNTMGKNNLASIILDVILYFTGR